MSARILVIDDIDANVRLLEAKLSADYYEVLTATDGVTGIAMAAAERPDIILLDVMMPGLDGFQVCRRLKEDPATRHIPVVLITALDGRADRIAERIRLHVAGSPFRVADGSHILSVTISIGVAATTGAGDTPEALLKRADQALYEAKKTGRNRTIIAKAA